MCDTRTRCTLADRSVDPETCMHTAHVRHTSQSLFSTDRLPTPCFSAGQARTGGHEVAKEEADSTHQCRGSSSTGPTETELSFRRCGIWPPLVSGGRAGRLRNRLPRRGTWCAETVCCLLVCTLQTSCPMPSSPNLTHAYAQTCALSPLGSRLIQHCPCPTGQDTVSPI